jgi:hypothetical protein
MAILSGRRGKVFLTGFNNPLPATNVSVNSKAELIDTTNFTNQGFDSHAIGLYSAEITLDLLQVVGGYEDLKQGSVGSITILDGDDPEQFITITNCVVTALTYTADVKDVQKISLTFATYGEFDFRIGYVPEFTD